MTADRHHVARGTVLGGAGLLTLAVAATALANPLGWLHRRKSPPPATVIAKQARQVVAVTAGQAVRVRIGPESPTATVQDKSVRYLRFALDKPVADARIEIEIQTERHRTSPRFTILAPQIVVLDADGAVARVQPLQPLDLDIEPFRSTRLTGCLDVQDLAGFLLTTDPTRVGKDYEYNARTKAGKHPDRGFYNAHSSLQVYMRYADTGDAVLRVVPKPKGAAPCQSDADE